MRLLALLILLATVGLAPAASAVVCSQVFSNAVGTTSGRLDLQDKAILSNTGDRVLATTDLRIDGPDERCDGKPCIEGGRDAPVLDIPAHSTTADLINKSPSLSPGDYYYDTIDLRKGNTLTLTGAGQVRIHVRRTLLIRDQARINTNGDPRDLVFLVGGDVQIEDTAEVYAMVYTEGQLLVRDRAAIKGTLVAAGAVLQDQALVSHVSAESVKVPGVCAGDPDDDVVLSGALDFNIEVGALTVIDTYQKPEFTRVNFTQEFDAPPLVFTLPTIDGDNSAAHRIRNITAEGFDIMTLEPDGEDGPHVSMALNYLAVEPGVHELPGGRKLVVGTIDTRDVQAHGSTGDATGWDKVGFDGAFSRTPVVLGQIQTMVNEQEPKIPAKPSRPWLTTAISGVSASGMLIALERSESSSGSVGKPETIAYFALEPVSRMSFTDSNGQDIDMEAIRTDELVQGWGTCSGNPVWFARTWSRPPVVLATKNTRDGDAGKGQGDGGWLRRCKTTAQYTQLQVDEVRANKSGDRDRVHDTRERAGVVLFSGNFVMKARELDHFRLIHDGFGIAGVGEKVEIVACRDSTCEQRYTDSVTVTLEPGDAKTSWSGSGVLANQVTFSGGSKTVMLNRMAGGTVTLNLTATPTPRNGVRCFSGLVETCAMTYVETGLAVDLPDQVSGLSSAGILSLPTCWSAFQSRAVALEVATSYRSPVWQGPAVSVNGAVLRTDGTYTAVTLDFDAQCRAALAVDYPEAGEIGLLWRFVGSGALAGLTIAGESSMVFYPAALKISALNASGTVLDATGASASPVHVAGQAFTLSVGALNAQGKITQGYRPQGSDRLRAYVRRTGPATGFEGVLSLAPGVDLPTLSAVPAGSGSYLPAGLQGVDFVDGVFSNGAAAYSEVGLITLYLEDSDYLGHGIVAPPTAIGRFVPAGFQASGAVTNRIATAGCMGSGFTYLGEQLGLDVQLTAVNATGLITRNYQGSHARLAAVGLGAFAGGAGNTLGAVSGASDLSPRLAIDSASLGVPWAAGTATLDVLLRVLPGTGPDGPHDNTRFGLALRDADGVALQGLDTDVDGNGLVDHLTVASTVLRFGRLSVGNAHGSELRPLTAPVAMQFFAGTTRGFAISGDDHCTPLGGIALADADAADTLALIDTCVVDDAGTSGAHACPPGSAGTAYTATPSAGRYAVALKPPGAGRTGAVRLTADAPVWAEFDWTGGGATDPLGTVTFGVYSRESGIIYQRDLR